ncbi:hypothetical protein pb186bvf_019248 [Paramecium bursaria]
MEVLDFILGQALNVGKYYSSIQGIVIGPLLGYVAQYNLIRKSKSVGSFSTDVCAILLIANILRVFFWYYKRFDTSLLVQSILMIGMQIFLLNLCLQVNRKQQIKWKDTSFIQSPLNNFWRWTALDSYVIFLIVFVIVMSVLTQIFFELPFFWEIVGFASCFIESALGMPQSIKNHLTKSVAGLSYAMIFSWFFGDAFKTFYYIVKSQPAQFVMCGVIQLIVDIWILGQIALYKKQEILEL